MADNKIRFKVRLIGQEGSSAAGFYAPFDVPATFGTRARVPVRGTINGYAFRSSLMPMGGGYCMAVNKSMREGAKVKVGDEVDVVLERDQQERSVEAPAELAREFKRNKAARERVGRTRVHDQERNGHLDQRCQAGRDQEAPAGEGNDCASDGREVGRMSTGPLYPIRKLETRNPRTRKRSDF